MLESRLFLYAGLLTVPALIVIFTVPVIFVLFIMKKFDLTRSLLKGMEEAVHIKTKNISLFFSSSLCGLRQGIKALG